MRLLITITCLVKRETGKEEKERKKVKKKKQFYRKMKLLPKAYFRPFSCIITYKFFDMSSARSTTL